MFSNGTVQAQTSTKEVRGDLVLELLHPVDGHHRNPHAVAPRELQVAVDVHHLEGEPGPLALGRQHRRGRLAEVAPAAGVEGDPARRVRLRGRRRLGRVRRGVRRTLRDGAAPASPPAHGWRSRGGPGAGRGLGSGAEARRKPAYITVAPRASPVASWSLALAKAKTPPAAASSTPAALTSTSATATALARLNSTSPTR